MKCIMDIKGNETDSIIQVEIITDNYTTLSNDVIAPDTLDFKTALRVVNSIIHTDVNDYSEASGVLDLVNLEIAVVSRTSDFRVDCRLNGIPKMLYIDAIQAIKDPQIIINGREIPRATFDALIQSYVLEDLSRSNDQTKQDTKQLQEQSDSEQPQIEAKLGIRARLSKFLIKLGEKLGSSSQK
ncbi:hypothetical protein SP15_289 [Bacillus phage SP-15]|uniref:Uncharacterized protein n=1 Tax=Bacillus phage SP-15 TaxID=1792032 RepID=A0A127AWW7_9CAUD|nr:hypothetical protein SP15_289 [Bacillus phage SP-15]AMM45097.1 hypothetical protein SP15_289 [Bacillus phage SP-15]